jgi:hypothetical protein
MGVTRRTHGDINSFKFLVEKPERKRQIGRPERRFECNSKTNRWIPNKAESILNRRATISF